MSDRQLPRWRATTTARVTVQVEVHVGSWGPECDLNQVYRQASESAISRVRRAFEGVSGTRIVKVSAVEAISTSMEVSR